MNYAFLIWKQRISKISKSLKRVSNIWSPDNRDGRIGRHSGMNSLKVYTTLKHTAPAIK